ncbi:hypothetical protein [Sphingobacterium sp. CZ-UAM]|uniref:hypothetical protein n=1 Tax=Sphingobacterium sp. CZ-UAM TaxID=1933868 RepID=UPI001115A066|nr:hypothetical protein [Sphingobacterium sp. CZ-UAM]
MDSTLAPGPPVAVPLVWRWDSLFCQTNDFATARREYGKFTPVPPDGKAGTATGCWQDHPIPRKVRPSLPQQGCIAP